jgi:hypothetical protein
MYMFFVVRGSHLALAHLQKAAVMYNMRIIHTVHGLYAFKFE